MRSISLEYIGNRLERSGFIAVCSLLESGDLANLRVLSLRHASWLTKKQIAAIMRAVSSGRCQLHELVLSQTHLCVTAFGHYSVDAVRELAAMLTTPGNQIRKLDLRGTCLCGTPLDVTTGYTLEGIQVLCAALAHPECAVSHLELSENGIKAEADEPAPSTLPPALYKIGKADGERLAALHPEVCAVISNPGPAVSNPGPRLLSDSDLLLCCSGCLRSCHERSADRDSPPPTLSN